MFYASNDVFSTVFSNLFSNILNCRRMYRFAYVRLQFNFTQYDAGSWSIHTFGTVGGIEAEADDVDTDTIAISFTFKLNVSVCECQFPSSSIRMQCPHFCQFSSIRFHFDLCRSVPLSLAPVCFEITLPLSSSFSFSCVILQQIQCCLLIPENL